MPVHIYCSLIAGKHCFEPDLETTNERLSYVEERSAFTRNQREQCMLTVIPIQKSIVPGKLNVAPTRSLRHVHRNEHISPFSRFTSTGTDDTDHEISTVQFVCSANQNPGRIAKPMGRSFRSEITELLIVLGRLRTSSDVDYRNHLQIPNDFESCSRRRQGLHCSGDSSL